ncbi:MAG: hypothetical protein JKY70_19095 [Mucilaginibacter sp.]|nr:hypothetical protein [Mucilaginibacter sp.]
MCAIVDSSKECISGRAPIVLIELGCFDRLTMTWLLSIAFSTPKPDSSGYRPSRVRPAGV